jgi:PilZ domain
MAETLDRRGVARLPVPRDLRGPELEPHLVHLLELSPRGARIEALEALRAGAVCYVDLPSTLGHVRLTGRVVWTGVRGSEQTLEGDRRLHYQSGLAFTGLTPQQETTLAVALETLQAVRDATGPTPSRRRSAA